MKPHALFACALAFAANAALAGDCVTREIEQNDKMRTYDHLCLPGDGAPMAKRGWRAFYVIEGSMIERRYEDGSKEVIDYKAGDSRSLIDDKAFSYHNVGKTPFHLYVVYPK
ncbi:MAG TPA: hypothetical protein VI279_01440 [Rhodocyclaceae bacterium]